jgi:hypothetical protein
MAIFRVQQNEGTEVYLVREFNLKELEARNDVEAWKKEYLEHFCMNECKDTCCNDLLLREDDNFELFDLTGVKKVKWPGKENWYYPLNGYCKYYDINSKKCKEHNNPKRPQGCLSFPITFRDNNIILSDGCYLSRSIAETYRKCSKEATSLVDIAKIHKLDIYVGKKIYYQQNIDSVCCLNQMMKCMQ